MWLQTKHIESWGKFIEENEINLACPICEGACEVDDEKEGIKYCEECGGVGYIEPMWNTIWNTGFYAIDYELPQEFGSVFAFEYNGEIWFGLSGCGMDLTPSLAAAWVEMFDATWLPEQFMVTGINLTHSYVVSVVGKEKAAAIYKLMRDSWKSIINNANYNLKDLDEAEAKLQVAPAGHAGGSATR